MTLAYMAGDGTLRAMSTMPNEYDPSSNISAAAGTVDRNVGHFAVNPLISSVRAKRVAYLDEPSVLPCASNNAFGPDAIGDLTLALTGLVFDSIESPVLCPPSV